ncbi:MAG: NRDE family protein, partial [Bacteroidetes bacterium]|nr:NRDE family protein [Bacteroidota bacterium]
VADSWLDVLSDSSMAEDDLLPETGVGLDKERMLSALRLVSASYGTRCSTFVRVAWDGAVEFAEKTWVPAGLDPDTVAFDFEVE